MYRDRRTLLFLVPLLAFLLIATSLYLNREFVSRVVLPKLRLPAIGSHEEVTAPEPEPKSTPSATFEPLLSADLVTVVPEPATSPTPSAAASPLPAPSVSDGDILNAANITRCIDAILDPNVPRGLTCPSLNEARYAPLTSQDSLESHPNHIDFFFALNLRNNLPILPRLLGSIVEVVRFLGPERCALSIVEGNSPDGTADVLGAMEPFFEGLNLEYYFSRSDINPKKGDRIVKLAKLRNLALEPLYLAEEERVTPETTVLFINDVAACPDDILELALQRRNLGADMTCAMDWNVMGNDIAFYDVWISRTINGDSFFHIPDNGAWSEALNIFWNDPKTYSRFEQHQPFQVFACWNGAVAFTAAPLLDGVRFRGPKKGDCRHGEPQILCKDFWLKGYGNIAVIPTVNLEYTLEKGRRVKSEKGYVSELVKEENTELNTIDWEGPPEQVRCIEGWTHQFWKPWKVSRRGLQVSWRK